MKYNTIFVVAAYLFLPGVLSSEDRGITETCAAISRAISPASAVYYPDSSQYNNDVAHWALSSVNQSVCSVEPGTPQDVGTILRILGESRTPFAVKGCGHTSNAGFSSTGGVQISMSRFVEVDYDSSSQTASVGAGMCWGATYAALEPHNVSVVGGRSAGVGVAGLTLGGGYSWHSNQYGLALDNVHSYELVLPNGTMATVSEDLYPDLFFGLRGGFNNFGIITKFHLKAHPQGQVWGGVILFSGENIQTMIDEVAKFLATADDDKIVIALGFFVRDGEPHVSLNMMNDAPTQPAKVLDSLLAIPSTSRNLTTSSFPDFVERLTPHECVNCRVVFNTITVEDFTPTVLSAIANETSFWYSQLQEHSPSIVNVVQSFMPNYLSHTTSPSAWPPVRDRGLYSVQLYFLWDDPKADSIMHKSARQSIANLRQVAMAEGQHIAHAALYANYAMDDTPVEAIYGDNVPRLKALKKRIDPHNVMGLAGGFKF